MPEPEELEITLLPDGTMLVSLCSACVLGDKDDRCKAGQLEFVRQLVREGHVIEVSG